jgi:type 1 glutamine amidotransferase
MAEHPVLANVKPARFHSSSWIYRLRPLAESATVLMNGRWSEAAPEEPVAWTNTYNGGRVFYTTLGHPDDFEIESFNQLLLGGVRWALQIGI